MLLCRRHPTMRLAWSLGVSRHAGVPRALGSVPVANPRSQWNVQRQKRACFVGLEDFWAASLRAPRHKVHDFSKGLACFGHDTTLVESFGRCPCQTSCRRLSPSGLQISESSSTLRHIRHRLSRMRSVRLCRCRARIDSMIA